VYDTLPLAMSHKIGAGAEKEGERALVGERAHEESLPGAGGAAHQQALQDKRLDISLLVYR
jgi:hypothetical protein